MTEYTIKFNNINNLIDWVKQQPNFNSIGISENEIICDLTHDVDQSKEFKQQIANKLFQFIIDGTNIENILPKLESLQTDLPLISITRNMPLNNLDNIYTDVFPALYDGFPIPIHTIGYIKMGFVLLWNKNGGVSNHDLRLVKCDINGIVNNPVEVLIEGLNIPNGRTTQFDFNIPNEFINFRGFVKLQARSGNGTDDPQFDGLFIYLIR